MKTDKRIRYTKMFLKEALIELLHEKPISKITIKELCEKAEINRSTFYTHYIDQYDLLDQIKQELLDNSLLYIDSIKENTSEDHFKQTIFKLLHSIIENKDLIYVLWGKYGDMGFQEQLIEIFKDKVISFVNTSNDIPSIEDELIYFYNINGFLGIIRKWIFDEYDNLSVEDVANLLIKLYNYTWLIGVK